MGGAVQPKWRLWTKLGGIGIPDATGLTALSSGARRMLVSFRSCEAGVGGVSPYPVPSGWFSVWPVDRYSVRPSVLSQGCVPYSPFCCRLSSETTHSFRESGLYCENTQRPAVVGLRRHVASDIA